MPLRPGAAAAAAAPGSDGAAGAGGRPKKRASFAQITEMAAALCDANRRNAACALLRGAIDRGSQGGFLASEVRVMQVLCADLALRPCPKTGRRLPGVALDALKCSDPDLNVRALRLQAELLLCTPPQQRWRMAAEGLAEATAALGGRSGAGRHGDDWLPEQEAAAPSPFECTAHYAAAAEHAHWFRFHQCCAGAERVNEAKRPQADPSQAAARAAEADSLAAQVGLLLEGGVKAADEQLRLVGRSGRRRRRCSESEEDEDAMDEDEAAGSERSYSGGEQEPPAAALPDDGPLPPRRQLRRAAHAAKRAYAVLSTVLERICGGRSGEEPAGCGPVQPRQLKRGGRVLARDSDRSWYGATLEACHSKDTFFVRFGAPSAGSRRVGPDDIRPSQPSLLQSLGCPSGGESAADKALGALGEAARMAQGRYRARAAEYAAAEARSAASCLVAQSAAEACAISFAVPVLYAIAGGALAGHDPARSSECFGKALSAIKDPVGLVPAGEVPRSAPSQKTSSEVLLRARNRRSAAAALPYFHLLAASSLCAMADEGLRGCALRHLDALLDPGAAVDPGLRCAAACLRALALAWAPQQASQRPSQPPLSDAAPVAPLWQGGGAETRHTAVECAWQEAEAACRELPAHLGDKQRLAAHCRELLAPFCSAPAAGPGEESAEGAAAGGGGALDLHALAWRAAGAGLGSAAAVSAAYQQAAAAGEQVLAAHIARTYPDAVASVVSPDSIQQQPQAVLFGGSLNTAWSLWTPGEAPYDRWADSLGLARQGERLA
eukprot:TRINITY_DN1893_c0_g1_i1.p1 TRINITY_DN1893_c0_g1~~TRINITY_DN1893_c0_g1_i1.p1  ORF type:complete len:804 (+),score=268.19 TRINITY_DN1893_c0_g1_i1:74-2413(+)